jgi:hypothetical protein
MLTTYGLTAEAIPGTGSDGRLSARDVRGFVTENRGRFSPRAADLARRSGTRPAAAVVAPPTSGAGAVTEDVVTPVVHPQPAVLVTEWEAVAAGLTDTALLAAVASATAMVLSTRSAAGGWGEVVVDAGRVTRLPLTTLPSPADVLASLDGDGAPPPRRDSKAFAVRGGDADVLFHSGELLAGSTATLSVGAVRDKVRPVLVDGTWAFSVTRAAHLALTYDAASVGYGEARELMRHIGGLTRERVSGRPSA